MRSLLADSILLLHSLAWAEIYLLVAALVQSFDFTIKDAQASDFELVKDNFATGTKAGPNLLTIVESRKGY